MRKIKIISVVLLILAIFTYSHFEPARAQSSRECVLDRISHLEDELVTEIPAAPRLCDGMKVDKKRVDLGDCELYCEIEGRGTPLVLINGGPGGTHHGFHPYFSRAASFAKVIYYDQRGCGLSDHEPGDGYTVSQALSDLDRLRKALGIEKWVVLGWSYGGMLAQRYTLKYPETVAGMVLVGSSPAMDIYTGNSRQYDYMTGEEIDKVRRTYRDDALTPEAQLFNAHNYGDWKRQSFYRPTTEQLARMVFYEWKHDPEFRSSIFRSDYKVDLKGAFDDCPIPTLIMEGKWDLTWGEEKAKNFHAHHPRAELMVFERSAHGPFEDEPDEFFASLRKFMKNLREASPSELSGWKERLAEWKDSSTPLPPLDVMDMTDSEDLTRGVLHCTTDPATGNLDVFLSDPFEKKRRNLTGGRMAEYRNNGWFVPWGVKGSPDGKSVAFRQYRRREGRIEQKIWILDMQDLGLRQVPGTYHCGGLSWSSDSRHVGFACRNEGNLDVMTVDRATLEVGTLARLGKTVERCYCVLHWSPDGKWIAARANANEDGKVRRSLRLVSTETGEVRNILPDFAGNENALCWSPDGKTMALTMDRRLSLLSLDGKILRQFGEASNANSWSPDGRHILYDLRLNKRQVWILDVAKGAAKRIRVDGDAYAGRWCPGGEGAAFWHEGRLVFAGSDGGNPVVIGNSNRGSTTAVSWLWPEE